MRSASERIIFIPFIEAFGGGERLALDLSRYLHERETPHRLVCFKQTIDLQKYADWPLRTTQILTKRNSIVESRALNKFLGSTSPQIQPLLFDLKSAFYCGLYSIRSFALHLTDPPSLLPADMSKHSFSTRNYFRDLPKTTFARGVRGELVHWLNRRGVTRASKVIVMTESIRKELKTLYGVDALVVRPGVSVNSPNDNARQLSTTSPLRLLSVSRLEPNKRIDWILRALATLGATSPEWVFEVVGEGSSGKELKTLAEKLGIAGRTIFRGHISDEELHDAYSRANLYLMPALQGYGLPALEALNRGIPTIVHRASGVSEILEGSEWVELVDGNNGRLSAAIQTMLRRLAAGKFHGSAPPKVPASADWAAAVCRECGWTLDA